jgi:hypothetical protein
MRSTRRLAALVSAATAGIGIYLGLVGPATFPAARFASFAESGITSASRLLVVDGEGAAHDLEAYARLQCVDYRRKSAEECGMAELGSYGQLDAERTAALETRLGTVASGAPVKLVRRAWVVSYDEVEARDCPIADCLAVPR